MTQYLMTIDAGTGSIRVVLFDLLGQQIAYASREWIHKEDPLYKGSMDFDIFTNWGLIALCIREALAKSAVEPACVAGIITTSMREAIVLYDKDLKEIWACANVDSRAGAEVGQLKQASCNLEKEIYQKTGQTFALSSAPRLLWLKTNLPEVYDKFAYISMINDWINYRLCGVLTSEPSNSSTTGLLDIKSRAWDREICRSCGVKDSIFPPVEPCGHVVGNVSALVAKETGLMPGTPILTGGGDAQLGSIGIGLINPGEAAVFGGSFWQYEVNASHLLYDNQGRVRINCHAVNGLWQYEALAFFPGLIMRWYRDAFCQEEKIESEVTGRDAYTIMAQKSEHIPAGSHGIMCTFSDIMNFMVWKHASPTFTNFNFDSEKSNKYSFFKAIMENTCYVTRGHLELVQELTGSMPNEIFFASGASKSPMWAQILADVLELPVKVPCVKEATALGGAILSTVGLGIYKNINEACEKMVHMEGQYFPNPKNRQIYRELYGQWRTLYKEQLNIADKKITNYMWLGPGL